MKTQCGHYFCEECALQHNAKNAKCAACQQRTLGTFNTADDIVRTFKLESKGGARPSDHKPLGAADPAGEGDGGWQAEEEDAAEDTGGWS